MLGGSDLQIRVKIPMAAGMFGGELGNRFMARETYGRESARDPLMGAPIRPERCDQISLS